ncbi:MAG: helix-turn-helix domain-containing protein [Verrucomicrobiae bacterium]|nr:helix-turn-helix domain-containing protein [Verrucomicrobiae bacterium]
MKNLVHGEDAFNIPFIRAELDDYILTANQFRVYAHLARRAGRHAAWPSVLSMARTCRLREETIRQCVGRLRKLNLIETRLRKGHTTLYTLTPLSSWTPIPPEERVKRSSLPETGWNFNPYPRRSQRGRKQGHERSLFHGENAFNVLFIRSELDDYILTANQFRVYAHLARRAGTDGAWPSIKSMARTCRLHGDTVRRCLRCLRQLNLVRAQARRGATTLYILTPYSDWKKPQSKGPPSATRGALPVTGSTPPPDTEGGTPHPGEGKVSHEGNPEKVKNTVGGGSRGPNASRARRAGDGGRPASGPSAMNGQARFPSGPRQESRKTARSQTSLRRKAFAVASRLESLHWDNCKVAYALHAARSYAEQVMEDGHDESAILDAYRKALQYTHGVTTDEMDRGERSRHELATPALTIYLARCALAKDGKTVEQRREQTRRRLHEKRRKDATEDQRLHEEALHLAPEVAAWFAERSREATLQGSPPSVIGPTTATSQATSTGVPA